MNKFLSLITICVILAVADAGAKWNTFTSSGYYNAELKLDGEHQVKGSLEVYFPGDVMGYSIEFVSKEILQPHSYYNKIFTEFPLDNLDHVIVELKLPLLSKIKGSSADIHIDYLILVPEKRRKLQDLKFCPEDPSKPLLKSGEKVKLTRCKV